MTVRRSVPDFALANPLYAGATVTFYTVTESGARTTVKASIYETMTEATKLANPLRLDAEGKFRVPVYIDEPVVAVISGIRTPSHETGVIGARGLWRGAWTTATLYYATDFIFDTGGSILYTATDDYTSGASLAVDVAAGKLDIVIRVGDFLAGTIVETLMTGNGTVGPYGPLNSAAPSGITLIVEVDGLVKDSGQFTLSPDGRYVTFGSAVTNGARIMVKSLASRGGVLLPDDGTITPRMLFNPFDLGSVSDPATPGSGGGAGTGTVTSISTINGLEGGPITVTGSIGIAATGVVAGTYGGSTEIPQITVNSRGQLTGVTPITLSAAGLGAQPLDATLTAIAAVATAADRVIYATGVDAFSTAALTSFGRSLIGAADAAAGRTALAAAPLASPTFTGIPAGPTAAGGTNTTQLATTAFVAGAISPLAPLVSPALTGAPTTPTAATSTSTTQIASTAFVQNAAQAVAQTAIRSIWCGVSGGTANAQTLTSSLAAFATGTPIEWVAGLTNGSVSRTQLLGYTSQLDLWPSVEATVAPNAAVAPDGTTVADKIIPSTNNVLTHKSYRDYAVSSGATVTQSVYLAAAGYNYVLLRLSNTAESNALQCFVNLSTGAVISSNTYGTGVTLVSADIKPTTVAGVYRVILIGAVSGQTTYRCAIYPYSTAAQTAYAGDGTSGIYACWADVQAGVALAPHIPNATASALTVTDGSTTLAVGSTGARVVTDAAGTALAPGAIAAGTKYHCTDDGVYWRLSPGDAPSIRAGSATFPGLPVVSDTNTGIAQLGGADTLSMVAGGVETVRWAAGVTSVLGSAKATSVSLAYAASITLDLSAGNEFNIAALTGNLTLPNPTNAAVGQEGIIYTVQDGTGGRTISFGGNWKRLGSATVTTTASKVNAISFAIPNSASEILYSIIPQP